MKVTHISSKYGKIFASQRTLNGARKTDTIEDFQWYFYCEPISGNDLSFVKRYASKIQKHSSGLLKVFCQNDSLNRWDLEKGKIDNKTIILKYLVDRNFKTYEADFDPWKRYFIDKNVEIEPNPVIVYWDIETDDTKQNIEIGRDQILSFAFNLAGKNYFFSDRDERKVLLKIKSMFDNSDIICGWNTKQFDLPYVLARFQLHGIEYYPTNLVHFDLMEIFKKRYKFSDQDPITNFNLENICQLFLGKGKVKHSETIRWLFDNDLKKLEKYNKEDVNLLHELDKKLGIMELIIGVCVESRTPYKHYFISELVDNYILQEAKKHARILPSNMWKLLNREGSSDKQKYTGGAVFDVTTGLHDNVVVWDFNSMYPNVLITWNIGLDTFLGKDLQSPPNVPYVKTPSGCYFRKDIKSINAIVAEKLLSERKEVKKKMKDLDKESVEYKVLNNKSEIIKVISNSQYGIVGSEYSRHYSVECAESITLTAQYLLKFTHHVLTTNGKYILSGDTDSVFIKDL